MTIQEIERAADRAGSHFFDADSRRFFRSRILEAVYQGPGGVYFVTSEQFRASDGYTAPRCYTVRQFKTEQRIRESDGRQVEHVEIDTVGEFNKLSKYQAQARAKLCAEYGPEAWNRATAPSANGKTLETFEASR